MSNLFDLQKVPDNLLVYYLEIRDELVNDLRGGYTSVLVFDKLLNKHYKKEIFRSYKSIGKIPEFDETHKKSYMFTDGTKDGKTYSNKFEPFYIYLKSIRPTFNQFVINLYETGANFIEPHSDCDKNMTDDYIIASLSLGCTRTMKFTHRNTKRSFKIPLTSGTILLMSKELNRNWRHHIDKEDAAGSRISITAREMA